VVRQARTECGRLKKKCRSEKENERIVRKMHTELPVVRKQG